ncbi:MAG: thymidine kinase [Candidatus Krumholzibacteria bacterium]|nr:thymidine kinase [Candidatus Krumholzibacteria bacterium]
MQIIHGKTGWIEVICGPMFSGKSEELIKRLRRAQIAKRRVQIFKHGSDVRYDASSIVSHSQQTIASVAVTDVRQILDLVDDRTELVAIDEAQFFNNDIIAVTNTLANRGKRVIVAGLELDFMGVPFGPMPQLLCCAEYVTKQLAICMTCGDPANFSQRLTQSTEQVVVGAADVYEARCRLHFEPPCEMPLEEADQKTDGAQKDNPGAHHKARG